MEKIIALTSNLKEKFVYGFLILFGAWLIFALGLIFYTVFLEATGNETALQNMANQFEWKFDGTFKNDPNNIWYNADEQMFVESVTNKVVIGKLAGNRNLAFGVKNILEEFLQEKGYNLSPSAPNKLQVEIIFLDVLTTKKIYQFFTKTMKKWLFV